MFQNTGNSLFPQTTNTGSLFGGTGGGGQSTFGGSSLFGGAQTQMQNQTPGGGLFGQQQPQNQMATLGGFGQQVNSGFGSLAGAGPGAFSQGVGFGGQNAPSNQNTGFGAGGFNTFSQATTQVIGQQPAFGTFQQANTSGFGGNQLGGGLLGNNQAFGGQPQQTNTLFGGNSSAGFQNKPTTLNPQEAGGVGQGFYVATCEQFPHTFSVMFQEKSEQGSDKNGPQRFYNIKAEPKFSQPSVQMLKIADMMAQKTSNYFPSYEFTAQNEFRQNQNSYIFAQKVAQTQQMSAGGMQGQGLFGKPSINQPFQSNNSLVNSNQKLGGGGLFGGQQPQGMFGQSMGSNASQPQSLFGSNNQGGGLGSGLGLGNSFSNQPQQNTLFGGQNNQQKPGGLFGNNAGTAGSTGLFGNTATPNQQPGGLFGNSQPTQNQFGAQPTSTLFGQQPQAQSTLFGQNQATPQLGQNMGAQNQGGLFGNTANQNTANKGLFGNQTTQNTGLFGANQGAGGQGGLFGANQQQQQPGGTGLFGNQQNANPSLNSTPAFGQTPQLTQQSSLFGGQQQQQQNQSSLFSGQTNQGGLLPGSNSQSSLFGGQNQLQSKPSSSLFGPSPTPSGSLFSNPTNTGSTLFGNQNTNQQQSSLFGNQQQQNQQFGAFSNPSTSLFSGQQQQQQNQGSLFQNQAQPQYQQQQQQQINPMQQNLNNYLEQLLYNPHDYFGTEDNFLSKKPQYISTEEDLQKLRESIAKEKISNPYIKLQQEQEKTKQSEQVYSSNSVSVYQTYNTSTFDQSEIEKERQQFNNQLKQKFILPETDDKVTFSKQSSFSSSIQFNNSSQGRNLTFAESNKELSNQFQKQSQELIKRQKVNYDSTANHQFLKPTLMNNQPSQGSIIEPAFAKSQSSSYPDQPNKQDLITIDCVLFTDIGEIKMDFNIHKSRDVDDIYKKIEEWLVKRQNFNKDSQVFKLLYKNQILKKNQKLSSAEIKAPGAKIIILIDEQEHSAPKAEVQPKQISSTVISSRAPKPPKQGYVTTPNMESIMRMSEQQLQNVQNFKIENPKFGSIIFDGRTDITDLDLADIVTIENQSAEVYDDTKHVKPSVGEKLNKKAIITLYQVKCKENETRQRKEQKLKQIITNSGGEHIFYNDRLMQWQFKVEHFTKYGAVEDEEAEEEVMGDENDIFHESRNEAEPLFDSFVQELPAQEKMREPAQPDVFNKESIIFSQPQLSLKQSLQQPIQPMELKARYDAMQADMSDIRSELSQDVLSQGSKRRMYDEKSIQSDLESPLIFKNTIKLQNKQKSNDMNSRIKERLNRIKNIELNPLPLPSIAETTRQFKQMGVTTFKKTSLARNYARPICFRSDGSLAFVNKQNNIQFRPTKQTQASSQNDQAKIIVQNLSVVGTESRIGISNQLNSMSLNQRDVEMRVASDQNPQATHYDDKFFDQLLRGVEMPESQFKQNPKDLCIFLHSIAEDQCKLIIDAQKNPAQNKTLLNQLNNEFYVYCMLNALFGNPNVHLVQLHNNFTELKTIKEDLQHFNDFTDGDTLEVARKRKNAVSELIRFICQKDPSLKLEVESVVVNPLDKLYEETLIHLINGDLTNALNLLNSQKKHKMAMIVASNFNNQVSRELLAEQLTTNKLFFGKFNKSALKIVQLLAGQFDFKAKQLHWTRVLNNHLLVKSNPNSTLKQILESFDQTVYKANHTVNVKPYTDPQSNRSINLPETHILYLLLKLYANIDQSQVKIQLESFFNVCLNINQQANRDKFYNFGIKWMTQFVVRQVGKYYRARENANRFEPYLQNLTVSDTQFSYNSIQWVHELLKKKNNKHALVVASLIPLKALQRRFLFWLLLQQAIHLVPADSQSQTENYISYVTEKMKFPKKMVLSAKAIIVQYRLRYESAIDDWNNVENRQQALDLMLLRILPLYCLTNYRKEKMGEQLFQNKAALTNVLTIFKRYQTKIEHFSQLGRPILDLIQIMQYKGIPVGEKDDLMVKNLRDEVAKLMGDWNLRKKNAEGTTKMAGELDLLIRFVHQMLEEWNHEYVFADSGKNICDESQSSLII